MPSLKRYIEIDLLRTIAILLMVAYHLAYDLANYYGWSIDLSSPLWHSIQMASASLFLLLVGVTSALAGGRASAATHRISVHRVVKRASRILACALLVTVATYAFDAHTYVRFGILHLIAVSVLLLPFVRWLREWAIVLGIIVLLIHPNRTTQTSLLLPLGFAPPGFATVDYYPLLPWFGLILIGYGVGYFLYVRHREWMERFNKTFHRRPLNTLIFAGRHSLLVYMVHQPILLGVMSLVLGWPR